MGDINTSTLKRFLHSTGLRVKPDAIKVFGEKVSEFAKDLASKAAEKTKVDNRKTISIDDFTMEDENTSPESEDSTESSDTDSTEKTE